MKTKLFYLALVIFIGSFQIVNAQWNQVGPIWEGEVISGSFGSETALNKEGTIMAVSDPFRFQSNEPNPVHIYERKVNSWIETALIFNEEGVDFAVGFGSTLSFNSKGNILAIGIPGTSATGVGGRVEIYENINGSWTQIGDDIVNTLNGPAFGRSIDLSADGSTIAISSPFDLNQDRIGFVQVYKNTNDTWEQVGQTLGNGANDRLYGQSLSLSDDASTLLIGVLDPFSTPGRLEVYRNVNDTWKQVGQDIVGLGADSQLGSNTAISSDGNIIVGAAYNPNIAFTAYIQVYENQNDNWVQLGSTLMNLPSSLVNQFGTGLAISDDGSLLFTGDPNFDINRGIVEIFSFAGGDWQSIQKIEGSQLGELFGNSIAVSSIGDAMVIGSRGFINANNDNVGAVRFYENSVVLSIDENNDFENAINVYPNPFINKFTVDNSNAKNETSLILMHDVVGRPVKTLEMQESIQQFNLNGLSSGVYFLTILNENGKTLTKKIVKE